MNQFENSFGEVKSKAQLKKLQRAFADIIRKPLRANDTMLTDKRSSKIVAPNAVLSAHERLELYARQYWWRIKDSLYEDFPGVRRVLGDASYHKVAQAYLIARPSTSFTLRNLGKSFPEFLKKSKLVPASLRNLAFEVALLEWDKIEVFDAALASPPSATTPANARLTLSPALRIRELKYPAHRVIRGGDSGADHERTSNTVGARRKAKAKSSRLSVRPKPTFLATHRYLGLIYFKELSKNEFSLLSAIQKAKSLTAALITWRPKAIAKGQIDSIVGGMFQEWGALGWISVSPAKRSPRRTKS